MQPYLVSVAEILHEHGASMRLEGDVDLGSLNVGEETYASVAPAHFAIDLTNTGSGIVAMGDVSGEMSATCVRCLCDFPMLVTGEVEAFYVEDRYADEIPEETEAERVSAEGKIDLAPALVGAMVVEIPFAPVHDEECAGLCATCGADLNEGPCDCHEHGRTDNPFAALKTLLPEGAEAQRDESSEPEPAS